jgi:actin-related protein 5
MEVEKTEEDIARLAERRKEQGKKLQEMAARVRSERVGIYIYCNSDP